MTKQYISEKNRYDMFGYNILKSNPNIKRVNIKQKDNLSIIDIDFNDDYVGVVNKIVTKMGYINAESWKT